jgi:hypothetical protein
MTIFLLKKFERSTERPTLTIKNEARYSMSSDEIGGKTTDGYKIAGLSVGSREKNNKKPGWISPDRALKLPNRKAV